MKYAISSLFLVITASVFASGIAAPNFSGTWIRDAARSDENGSVELTVRHEGNSLQVDSKWSNRSATQVNYLLDGKENSVTDDRGNPFSYRATWDRDRLIIEGDTETKTPFGIAKIRMQQAWSLAADGKTLTVTTTSITSEFGDITRKQVYTRQQ